MTIMTDKTQRLIPDWAWALLAVAMIALTLMLFRTDRRPEPGPALLYDVSEHEAVADEDIRYRETARIPLAIERPMGLAVDRDGRLFIVGDNTLLTLDAAGRETARHHLDDTAHGVAVAPDGVVYLGMRDHVAVFTGADTPIAAWESLGERAWVTAIAADERHVFVADAGNKQVLRYDHAGLLLGTIDGQDGEERAYGFIVPSQYFDLALDGMGALWIVNPGKLGVEKYRPDGTRLGVWHQPGFSVDAFPGCCNPIHIAVKSDTSLVAAEKGINRIKTFAADRSFAGVVASPEWLNTGWNAAELPADLAPVRDLAVDGDDRVLALHGPLRAVLVFERLADEKDTN